VAAETNPAPDGSGDRSPALGADESLSPVLDVPRISGPVPVVRKRMAAVEDPTPFDPYAIADGGPDELGHCAPVALKALLLVHQAGVLPLNLHVSVNTNRAVRIHPRRQQVLIAWIRDH